MLESGELITVYRQIGGMMEAGVDILRITRVLRAQTDNARLLEAYDDIDHRLTMGQSLVEAIGKSPDVFSPFVISLVQQGEMRNDIGSAFLKAADYLQKDEAIAQDLQAHSARGPMPEAAASPSGFHVESAHMESAHIANASNGASANLLPAAPLSVIALDGLIDRLQTFGLRTLTIGSGLLLALALVWWSFEAGVLESRWLNVTLYSVAALFIGASGVWLQRRLNAERRREARCSFCGRSDEATKIQRAPRFAGAAICSRCAAIIASRYDAVKLGEEAQTSPSQGAQNSNGNPSDAASVTPSATSGVPVTSGAPRETVAAYTVSRGNAAHGNAASEEEYE